MDQPNAVDIPVWAYLLAVSIPAVIALVGVIWQGWLTRNRGTREHDLARAMLKEHGRKLDRIDGKVDRVDTKVDRLDSRVDALEAARPFGLREGA